MNRIELEDNGFPWSADAVEFMQSSYTDVIEKLCKLHGDNYIVFGCEVTGGSISSGAIVVDGELIPFEAGAYNAKFTISETSENVEYSDQVQRPAFFTRVARCTSNGSYNLADFKRIRTHEVFGETDWVSCQVDSRINFNPWNSSANWTDYVASAGFDYLAALKARRDANGNVFLLGGGGMITGITASYTFATLPEGMRPKKITYIPVDGYKGNYEGNQPVVMKGYGWVTPSGQVNVAAELSAGGFCPVFNCSFNID